MSQELKLLSGDFKSLTFHTLCVTRIAEVTIVEYRRFIVGSVLRVYLRPPDASRKAFMFHRWTFFSHPDSQTADRHPVKNISVVGS